MAGNSASDIAAKIALVEILIAAPLTRNRNVFKIAAIIFASQCDPEGVIEIGKKWGEVAQTLREAQKAVTSVVDSVSEEEWKSDDRDAFAETMEDVKGALQGMEYLAQALSIAMTVLGYLLLVLVIAMASLATYLLILGIASVIPWTKAVASAQIKVVAPIGYQALRRLEDAIGATGRAMAALVGAAAVIDAGIQIGHGNARAFAGDAFNGVVDSLDEIAAGAAAYWEVKGFGAAIKGGGALALPALGAGTGLNILPLPGPNGETAPAGQASAYGNQWIPDKGGWRDYNKLDTGTGWNDKPTPTEPK
ncbi:hypothetical protein [Phytomonospora endophytica]|uniref:Uncharacterized protein n=1 Tax=Phytomonospora endophytica TaxID=714109 RepID=A0A841FQS4_9ACTN|nr:hypothetical protein [Phytomonospora endophytica]MBB6034909.1 hypothetical protein [Phytomonospora endophytica]GIG70613.1 hypothetical protein Pen01_69080 [Phytomonospora endophytica]